ncbi:MAG TPA: hypothetical protein VNA20_02535 [Frankiaceae bacterium]|nr:hypothetical protein [Frankiaceae bacterium]
MPRPSSFLAVLLAGAVACTGGTTERRPDPDAALRDARARLAALARATADGSYDAEYRFVQTASRASGSIRIRQRPPQYRIDIASKGGAAFFALTTGVVSCSTEKRKATCFLVARPGEEVPGIFDPGVQRLFRDAVEDLATNPGDYLVRPADGPPTPSAPPTATAVPTLPSATPSPTRTATPSATPSATASAAPLPAGECFQVERVDTTPNPDQPVGFENGTYCFAEQGVATSITVASGTLTLVRLLAPPEPAAFQPPAKVQKLPDLSPTPKPSASKKK